MPGATSRMRRSFRNADAVSGRVVGAGHEHDVGSTFRNHGDGSIHVECEVVPTEDLDPLGIGTVGDDRVHRVRRHKTHRATSRTCERLKKLLQNLVRSVCRPQIVDGDRYTCLLRQVRSQIRPQRHSVTVGVAVQFLRGFAHGFGHIVDERLGRRMRVLVRVELNRNRQLRCAVRRLSTQVLANRKGVDRNRLSRSTTHRRASNRRRTASP